MSNDLNFQDYIASERDRLTQEAAALDDQHAMLQLKIDELNRELAAIDAYEATRMGGAPRTAPASRQRSNGGGWRSTVLQTISVSPHGMTRGEVLELLGVRGDRRAVGAVSNALHAMKSLGTLGHQDGRYYAAAPQEELRAAE